MHFILTTLSSVVQINVKQYFNSRQLNVIYMYIYLYIYIYIDMYTHTHTEQTSTGLFSISVYFAESTSYCSVCTTNRICSLCFPLIPSSAVVHLLLSRPALLTVQKRRGASFFSWSKQQNLCSVFPRSELDDKAVSKALCKVL